jgi:hypothetical protein
VVCKVMSNWSSCQLAASQVMPIRPSAGNVKTPALTSDSTHSRTGTYSAHSAWLSGVEKWYGIDDTLHGSGWHCLLTGCVSSMR